MTKNQRDYLADLANRKGVKLPGAEDWDTARASREIDRLKALPDKVFPQISEAQIAKISRGVEKVVEELHLWTFGE